VALSSTATTIARLRENGEPSRIYLNDPDFWANSRTETTDEDRSRLMELDSELLLPLGARNKLLGFISLGPKRSEEPYSGSDLRLLKSVAVQTGLALENADLMEAIALEVAARERFNREIEIAREVQERLFPQKVVAIEGLDYGGRCRPAFGVGGDYYDFLSLAGGKLGVAIGDVSGKGIAAALTMSALQAALRGEVARTPENPASVVDHLNRLLYELSDSNRYATFFYGQYHPVSREFTYVNAGHNPPLHFHKSGESWDLSRLEIGGTVIGLVQDVAYGLGIVTLAPGDVLVAFTDGASEAMNVAEEEWGEERLIKAIKSNLDRNAAQIIEQVITDVDAFSAHAGQHDDITLVVLRVRL
jgi:sigma-B regulation protein RsbU (phosphoserine phosphatase)